MIMRLYELGMENFINFSVRMQGNIETVFDLSYLLVDFQAVVNGLNEIVKDNNIVKVEEMIELSEEKFFYEIKEEKFYSKKKNTHPEWQQQMENKMESIMYPMKRVASKTIGYRQTTSRNFNKKYRDELILKSFSKGSLVLDMAASVITGLIVEFIKNIMIQKTGNDNIMQVIIENNYIIINDSDVKYIPKNSCISQAITVVKASCIL